MPTKSILILITALAGLLALLTGSRSAAAGSGGSTFAAPNAGKYTRSGSAPGQGQQRQ